MGKETIKTTTTRTTETANATEETKEDEYSSSYVSTDVFKGKEKKDVDVNGVGDVIDNDKEETNDLSSAIKKKKENRNINKWWGGGERRVG